MFLKKIHKNRTILLFSGLLYFSVQLLQSQVSFLEKSYNLHTEGIGEKYLEIAYKEKNRYVSHSMAPWDIGSNTKRGIIYINDHFFQKSDTLFSLNGIKYNSKTIYSSNELYIQPYAQKELKDITQRDLETFLIKTLPYTPIFALKYCLEKDATSLFIKENLEKTISYSVQIQDYTVNITINKKNHQVEEITTFYDIEADDQFYGFGDVTDSYVYENYNKKNGANIPFQIIKTELNGRLVDSLHINSLKLVTRVNKIMDVQNFEVKDIVEEQPDISVVRYSKKIHLINLHHCGTRSLLVEFKNFLLVADAPLNSKYGEQLLAEVKKINSSKPIRYFTFGHFHPHYSGGIRPFIHAGAKIICVENDNAYISSIANAKHSLKPDRLELSPKTVEFENIYQAKAITDGSYTMTIYHIGKKSHHTKDYLIFYFPEEKMVFEDDLIWLTKNTNASNVSTRTKGFYQAIIDLNIPVKDVVQNWNVFDKENEMIFKFEDLKQIMNTD